MTFKEIDAYLLSKKGATFDYPFDDKVRVYRVAKKIFALMSDKEPLSINLKCNLFYALELRSMYTSVIPGYHMNKKHWNTVVVGGDVDDALLKELIDHSYTLIIEGLPKKQQNMLL
ncbi:MAG: MmcQ/YjbR family DNA-binding protein [Campylobacterales bacterium]|nr:MmcQ/YjbR family DNA-binding protein [Campylobacterales bacterium]